MQEVFTRTIPDLLVSFQKFESDKRGMLVYPMILKERLENIKSDYESLAFVSQDFWHKVEDAIGECNKWQSQLTREYQDLSQSIRQIGTAERVDDIDVQLVKDKLKSFDVSIVFLYWSSDV